MGWGRDGVEIGLGRWGGVEIANGEGGSLVGLWQKK